MSRFLACCLCLLVSPVFGQECIPGGFDLHITSDLLVDKPLDWSACDTYVDDGVTITLVSGGEVLGAPRFEGESRLVMEDGSIDVMSTMSGFPWGTIEGGESNGLTLISREHGSLISGGEHGRVSAINLTISGGSVDELSAYEPVTMTGGNVKELSFGYLFWSGGKLGTRGSEQSVVFVYGTNLDFTDRRLTGTLKDGTQVDQVFPLGEVILAGTELLDGDADRDGTVGLEDLNGIRNHFGENGYSKWDVNFDGQVELADLNMIRNNFGASSVKPVPEPSSFVLTVLGLSLLAGIPSQRRCRWLRSRSL